MTSARPPLPVAITQGRIIGILRNVSYEIAIARIGALQDAGLRSIEVAMGHPDSAKTIEAARKAYPDLTLGAGTITTTSTFHQAVDAGAQFLLSPNIDSQLIGMSVERQIPFIAGGHSATECVEGFRAGASAIKIFPASTGEVEHMRALLQPLPEIPFVPTGGVTPENALSYLDAGATAVGMGSSLTALQGSQLVDAIRRISTTRQSAV